MKLICECGREIEFIPESEDYCGNENLEHNITERIIHCTISYGNIDIAAEHDELWIACECGNSIHLFT